MPCVSNANGAGANAAQKGALFPHAPARNRTFYWLWQNGVSFVRKDVDGSYFFILKHFVMYILGINAAFHDSSACILKDGQLLAAAEEERFTHVKHGKRPVPFMTYELPFHAIDYCLSVAGIHLSEVTHVAYSFDPYSLLEKDADTFIALPLFPGNERNGKGDAHDWDPLFLSYIVNAPGQLVDGYPLHLQKRFYGCRKTDFDWHYVNHHLAHAASAFYPSPFEEASVLVLDGRGELVSTSSYAAQGTVLSKLDEVFLPHSLGLLYEEITTHLGFLHSSDEFKVMALASFGERRFISEFRNAFHLGVSGCTYQLDKLDVENVLGRRRMRGGPLTQHHFDIARSLQDFMEEAVIQLVGRLSESNPSKNLCIAGGVGLNCVLNTAVQKSGYFEKVWVQPAAGDAGTALGAALQCYYSQKESPRKEEMTHCYWGPEFSDAEIVDFLSWAGLPFRHSDDIIQDTVDMLVHDKIIGWFQGRMEFGPRALGARSILASPLHAAMQQRLNSLKEREDFRPVAPAVLEEDAQEWFECDGPSPFMLFVYPIRDGKEKQIPAVAHVDNTARIQTVNADQNLLYYQLLEAFKEHTGVPILTNTSFNTKSFPIVCTPRDAVECFFSSPMDVLVMGNYIIEKKGPGYEEEKETPFFRQVSGPLG